MRELSKRPEVGGSVVDVELELKGASYETADTFAVLPRNDARCVEIFGALLNQPLDAEFSLTPSSGEKRATEPPFPCPTTLREVPRRWVRLRGGPLKDVNFWDPRQRLLR